MTIKTKLKIWFTAICAVIAVMTYFVLNMEFVQKKLFDTKADVLGTNRTITFYTALTAEKVASYSDKDLRYETKSTGTISVWLGSKNKKVESNLSYIIEDN